MESESGRAPCVYIQSPSLHQTVSLESRSRVITLEDLQSTPQILQPEKRHDPPSVSEGRVSPRSTPSQPLTASTSTRVRLSKESREVHRERVFGNAGCNSRFAPMGGSLHVNVASRTGNARSLQTGSLQAPRGGTRNGSLQVPRSGKVAAPTVDVEEQPASSIRTQVELDPTKDLIAAVQQNLEAQERTVSYQGDETRSPSLQRNSNSKTRILEASLSGSPSDSRIEKQRILKLEIEIEQLKKISQQSDTSLNIAETIKSHIGSLYHQVSQEVLSTLKQQMHQQIQRVVDDRMQQMANAYVRTEIQSLGKQVVGDLQKIADEINTECEMRVRDTNQLHATLRFELASVRAHVEATRSFLEEADAKARKNHVEELSELRAILDSVWDRATKSGSESERAHYYFKYVDPTKDDSAQYKECVGDAEDINTLYEMVREALGSSIMVRKDLDEEKVKRELEHEKVERLRQDTLQLERRYQMLHGAIKDFRSPSS